MIRLLALAAGCSLLIGSASSLQAQTSPSAQEIIERLKSGEQDSSDAARPRTRGIRPPQPGAQAPIVGPTSAPSAYGAAPSTTPTPPAAIAPLPAPPENKAVVDKLLKTPSAKFSDAERQQAAAVARDRPAIDLTVYFDFNSSDITPRARTVLIELGKALSSEHLQGRRFLVAGHTDAKGTIAYNQSLSERRAAAIKRFLEREFEIPSGRLLAVGFGEEQLKNTIDPNAGDNRRVQIVNLGR